MNQMTAMTQATPPVSAKSAAIVAGLATLYHRHNDPARALALGVMAMRYGSDTAATVMLVASCFLKTGDAEQAAAALSRLEGGDLEPQERAASQFLWAKVHFRLGDYDKARAALAQANEHAGAQALKEPVT